MAFKKIKGKIRNRKLKERGVFPEVDCPVLKTDDFEGWAVIPDLVDSNSIVYSFGLGLDISWDLFMIERFGVDIHGFDPTPNSRDWLAQQDLPEQFKYFEYGISDFDGEIDFYPPKKEGRANFTQEKLDYVTEQHRTIKGKVFRLKTIMEELGHGRVDVLKLDVEGSEFEAVADIIDSGIEVGQFLLELHYHYPARSLDEGIALIEKLRGLGMRCFYVSKRGYEFGFVNEKILPES